MVTVPLSPTPSQSLSIVLDGQNCDISVYQKSTGMFFDLSKDGQRIVTAVRCLDGVPLINQRYRGFVGNLMFVDMQGDLDPTYDGLGSRHLLIYSVEAPT